MDQNKILRIFYEEIVPFASKKGIVEIDGIRYNIHFNSVVDSKEYIDDTSAPLLTITDVERFNKALINYVMKEYEIIKNPVFYDKLDAMCGYAEIDQIKYIMATVFCNAREEDFKNPVSFLKMRTDFIGNTQLNIKYDRFKMVANLDDKEIEVMFDLQLPSLETPYVFKSRIKYIDDGNIQYYDLPNISFGISDGTVYICDSERQKVS